MSNIYLIVKNVITNLMHHYTVLQEDDFVYFALISVYVKILITDILKMKFANNHGISIIRIYQPDVWKNQNNWEHNLKKAIKEYTEVTNIYIGKIYKSLPQYKTTYVK